MIDVEVIINLMWLSSQIRGNASVATEWKSGACGSKTERKASPKNPYPRISKTFEFTKTIPAGISSTSAAPFDE